MQGRSINLTAKELHLFMFLTRGKSFSPVHMQASHDPLQLHTFVFSLSCLPFFFSHTLLFWKVCQMTYVSDKNLEWPKYYIIEFSQAYNNK